MKSTYTAVVRVPAQLTALMSAVIEGGNTATDFSELLHLPEFASGSSPTHIQRFRQVNGLTCGRIFWSDATDRRDVWTMKLKPCE